MMPIHYIDRLTGKIEEEKVYGGKALHFLYQNNPVSAFLRLFVSRLPFFSAAYGFCQKLSCSKKKIRPFIQDFHVDTEEFLEPVESFHSFNDFFIRKLKPSARPIAAADAVIPADGRYYFYQNIAEADGFAVKGQKFDLASLLQDAALAQEYAQGSMLMARLCPSDYHRFHFPCDNMPGDSELINGYLYSVNPIAIQKNINIFTENKRTLCRLQTATFGQVLFLEIGATNVGSINQTYVPHRFSTKGSEKGFFAFGASALIVLFQPNRIQFDADLIAASKQNIEIRCLMGQSLGKSLNPKEY